MYSQKHSAHIFHLLYGVSSQTSNFVGLITFRPMVWGKMTKGYYSKFDDRKDVQGFW